MQAVFFENILLFRDDFIHTFHDFGVTNYDIYNAEIHDPDNGEIYSNYKVINIIGIIEAADMEKSNATIHDNVPLLDVDFDGLTIDEKKAKGHMFFSLAWSTSAIAVHEDLKNYLVANGFAYVCFNVPEMSAVYENMQLVLVLQYQCD